MSARKSIGQPYVHQGTLIRAHINQTGGGKNICSYIRLIQNLFTLTTTRLGWRSDGKQDTGRHDDLGGSWHPSQSTNKPCASRKGNPKMRAGPFPWSTYASVESCRAYNVNSSEMISNTGLMTPLPYRTCSRVMVCWSQIPSFFPKEN